MTSDRIKALLDERPFRPFAIHTPDGKSVMVNSPDFAWIHPTGRTMYVCPDPEVDAEEVIDLLQITKLTRNRKRRNGRHK